MDFHPCTFFIPMASLNPEKLQALRRLRLARRLWKQFPLLAFDMVREKYPDYSYDQFLCDLKPRRKRKSHRHIKNPLKRFGRFEKIEQLLSLYTDSGDPKFYLQAQKLRMIITRPYRLEIKRDGKGWEFTFPPETPYRKIEQLSRDCQKCQSLDEAVALCRDFIKTSGYGR